VVRAPGDQRGGRHPDYRFSLANERTFLAWLRTALALIGGGFAVDPVPAGSALGVAGRPGARAARGGRAVLAAGGQPLGALRAGDAPGRGSAVSRFPALLSIGVAIVAVAMVVVVLPDGAG